MGLLDQVGGALGGALSGAGGGGTKAVLLQQLVAMLSKPGALQNLTGAFQNDTVSRLVLSQIDRRARAEGS